MSKTIVPQNQELHKAAPTCEDCHLPEDGIAVRSVTPRSCGKCLCADCARENGQMKILDIRPDPRCPTLAVQVHYNGRWRSACRKFNTYHCLNCLRTGRRSRDFEFVLTTDEDRKLSDEEIEARFGIAWFFFIREDILRRCKICGKFTCTGYGGSPPRAYEHNGWGARPLPARLLPPMNGDDAPFVPDYDALAQVEPTSQYLDSLKSAGLA